MKKLITVCQIVVIAAVVSSLALGEQVINFDEKMVGANHPSLPDTLNRALLIDHLADGTHRASVIGSSQITDNSIINADINSGAEIDATKIGTGGVTSTEFGYIGTLTSDAQTQINTKSPTASPAFTGTVVIPTPFTLGAVSVTPTGTELNYVGGVTSAIQTQLNLKAPVASPTFTGTVTAPKVIVAGTDGGTIDNTVIGGTTPVAGTFTNVIVTTLTRGVVSDTEFGYLDNVSAGIQTQLNLKAPIASPAFTGNATFDNEVTAVRYNTTGADNVHYINVSNTSAPVSPSTGDCYYDNTVKLWSCYTGSAWMSGAIVPIVDNVSGPTAAQSYGSWNLVDEAITVLLPTAVKGMSTCVLDSGSAHDIIVDVQATDNVVLVGAVGAGGVGITNASGSSTGDFVCLIAAASNKWYVTTKQGTWASQ